MLEAMRVPFRDNLHLCNIINFFTKDEVVVAEIVREFWRNVFEKDRITRIMLGIQVTIDVSHVTSIAEATWCLNHGKCVKIRWEKDIDPNLIKAFLYKPSASEKLELTKFFD